MRIRLQLEIRIDHYSLLPANLCAKQLRSSSLRAAEVALQRVAMAGAMDRIRQLEALVQEAKPDLCAGTVEQGPTDGARKLLREAGFSHVQTTAALLERDGDGPKAPALLPSGWARPPAVAWGPPPGAVVSGRSGSWRPGCTRRAARAARPT